MKPLSAFAIALFSDRLRDRYALRARGSRPISERFSADRNQFVPAGQPENPNSDSQIGASTHALTCENLSALPHSHSRFRFAVHPGDRAPGARMPGLFRDRSLRYPAHEIADMQPKGIILSGGPASVYEKGAPQIDPKVFSLGIPVLGICYGMQLMARHLGGEVEFSPQREYGAGVLHIDITHSSLRRARRTNGHLEQPWRQTGGSA